MPQDSTAPATNSTHPIRVLTFNVLLAPWSVSRHRHPACSARKAPSRAAINPNNTRLAKTIHDAVGRSDHDPARGDRGRRRQRRAGIELPLLLPVLRIEHVQTAVARSDVH